MHLLLERADRCVDGGQLALHTITPELQHAQLALLMAPPVVATAFVADAAAAQGGKHEKVDKCPKVLASYAGRPSVVFPLQQWP